MLKIIKSLVVIVAVVAVAASVTGAVFSDTASVAGNTVATGTLELTLNKSAGKPFSVTNAYPCFWTNWEHMDIYNTGTLPFEAYMTLKKTSGSNPLYKKLLIEMETSGHDSVCHNGDAGEKTIYSGFVKDFVAHTLVSTKNFWHLANEDDGSGSPEDNIRAGYSERVCQKVGVDNSAGNNVQGTSVTFDEIVDAESDND